MAHKDKIAINSPEVLEMRRKLRNILTVIIITLTGMALRLWGIKFGLPYTFHPDEQYIIERAFNFSSENLNPHWFQWPGSLLMYIDFIAIFILRKAFALISAMSGSDLQVDLPTAYSIGRAVSVMFSLATIALVYGFAKRAYGQLSAVIATVLLATMFYPVLDAHYASPDTAMTFFVMVILLFSLYMLERDNQEGRLMLFTLGLLAGLGAAVKYTVVLALIPYVLIALAVNIKRKQYVVYLLSMVIISAGLAIGFVLGCPYCILDFATFKKDIVFELAHGAGQLRHLGFESFNPIFSYLTDNIPKTIGWPVFILAMIGIAMASYRRLKGDFVLLTFIIIYFLFLQRQSVVIDRYIMPVLPLVVILIGRFVAEAFSLAKRNNIKIAVAIALGVVVGVNLLYSARIDMILTRPDTRQLASEWVQANIPEGESIAYDSFAPAREGYNELIPVWRQNETWLDYKVGTIRDGARVLGDIEKAGADYVIISSSYYERFLEPSSAKNPNDLIKSGNEFYKLLDKNAKLLKEWDPNPKSRRFPPVRNRYDELVYFEVPNDLGHIERPGPTIRLYQLK